MADIEMGEFNDIQKSESWKLRAQNAELESFWICNITNIYQRIISDTILFVYLFYKIISQDGKVYVT